MYCFNNDYSEGAHPSILEAMMKENLAQNTGYGNDGHATHAADLIRQEIGRRDADIHFIVGGTQTNLIVIATALRPYQAVIAADTGHVNVHETGAIEATGHKVLAMPCRDGKLTPAEVQAALDRHTDEHMVQPKMVYISNTTELGTQYTKAELEALHHICNQKGLYLFMDGARMGAALTSPVNDLTLSDIAGLVDVFYIGGTKNGALFGEALILLNQDLKPDFRFMVKQRGALLAKGWLLGIQFEQLFQNHLFYDLARHSNQMAEIMRKAFLENGFTLTSDSRSNQIFALLEDKAITELQKDFEFQLDRRVDDNHCIMRFVTSWATREKDVVHFASRLKELA